MNAKTYSAHSSAGEDHNAAVERPLDWQDKVIVTASIVAGVCLWMLAVLDWMPGATK